jgi:hypothetical protein
MLGNHAVYAGAQATNRFDEFGGNITYINRTHRWNWGAAIDQTPYVYRSFNAGVTNIAGQPAYIEQEYRFLQTDRSMSGLMSYPFSRAHRVDFSGGFRQVAYKQDVTTRAFDYYSGQQISQDRENVATADALNLGEASAALVFDTSISGVASPIRGSRYRFEVAQTSGTISYTGLTADARTYRMPFRPVTFAFRGLFFGRYGSGAEDFRLPTLYLGYPGLVRGIRFLLVRIEPNAAWRPTARARLRSPARQPRGDCQRRDARAAMGPVRWQQLLRSACPSSWHCSPTAAWPGASPTASSSLTGRTRIRCRASAWRCAPTCSGSRSRSSITSGRSIGRTVAGSGSSI